MDVSTHAFEILGLPAAPVPLDELALAYQSARRSWFFRQFEPEYLLEAKEMLAKVEEAYRALRNPKCQAAVLKRLKATKRTDSARLVYEEVPADEPRLAAPPAVNRPLVVRELMQWAERLIARTHQPFTDRDRQELSSEAYKRGIAFSDAEELIERIVQKVEADHLPMKIVRRSRPVPPA